MVVVEDFRLDGFPGPGIGTLYYEAFYGHLLLQMHFSKCKRTKTGLMHDCRLFRAISFIFNNVALSVIIKLFLNKPKKCDI